VSDSEKTEADEPEAEESEAGESESAEAAPASAKPKGKTLAEKTAAKSASKKRKSVTEVQKELRDLSKPGEKPPVDMNKIYIRVAAVVAIIWIIAAIIHHRYGFIAAGVITVAAAGVSLWLRNYFQKTQKLGALLTNADTAEGRKEALEKISTEFKKDDVQAVLAKAQLLMQENPREALTTLEAVNLDKQMSPVAAQVRAMRAMIHLTFGEVKEARALADKLELGKQQEPKTRAMFAAVASEAWARTGEAQKAVDTLDLFNPEAPDMAEMRAQIWRARAFAYAGANDMKGAGRALRKLAEINPHLLGMFVGQKKIHPLLEREAKNIVMKAGIVPKKVVRQRV
jgi:hypothetical protein